MIAKERHRRIVDEVGHSGSARVSDLARKFDVTEETIRRDLRVLSQQGRLIRTHGGALAADYGPDPASHVELPFAQRDSTRMPEKRAIAAVASKLIHPGEVIVLDASSTACELARQLPDIPLTVVSNSLAVCSILSGRAQIHTICTGGVLDADAMAFVGLQAEKTLESFNVGKFFHSCRGIDPDRGISEADERQAELKLRAMQLATESILLVDTSKFGVASSFFYASADSVDLLVTDDGQGGQIDEALRSLQARGVTIKKAAVPR